MDRYVVRQAIKDLDNNIFGYEVLFQSEKSEMYGDDDGNAAANAIIDFLEQNGKRMFEDKIAFITFVPSLLFKSIPKIFDENKIVIQIDDDVLIHPQSYDVLKKYKEQNYIIGVKDFQFATRYFTILGLVDYIRLDFGNLEEAKISYENIIKTAKGFRKKCIAYGVDSKESYELAKEYGVDYFSGSYLEEKISEKVNKIDYIKSNFFMLVVEITKEEPDLAKIETIISRDVTLTYSLLKLVNSAYFALRNRTTTILQALVILGINGLKQWIYLLSFKRGEERVNEDLVKTSFLRANFCSELLSYTNKTSISKPEAYLMGMFSTLGVIVGAPLEELIAEIHISEEVKEALLHKTGPCGSLFNLVLSYEKANWKQINKYAEELGVPKDKISQIYFNCVETVNSTWTAFTTAFGNN
ncbi:MAG: HDOD domain-containing protein [Clostridiales bacterium]|nr:HDOD domain-containing protein [Clostridiales bacterium]